MKLLTLAAVSRQLGVCPNTAKKFLRNVRGVQVDANGRVMYRYDVLMDFIRDGGYRPENPSIIRISA